MADLEKVAQMTDFADKDEAAAAERNAIYDRQIRLWGKDAQKKIGGTKVLFLGFASVNVELCKNLVLAGFSATIADDGVVAPAALACNFFLGAGDAGRNVAEASAAAAAELNPFAAVGHDGRGLAAGSPVVCWGNNENGQTTVPSEVHRTSPRATSTPARAHFIARHL